MVLKNGLILDKSFRFIKADLEIENGKIIAIGNIEKDGVDLENKLVLPGLVDIHTHGAGGSDACDATKEAFDILSETQGTAGITSFCATSMTLPEEHIERIFKEVNSYMLGVQKKASIIGINMEGPFFASSKKGAQRGDALKLPDIEFFRRLNKISGYNIKLVDMAPELIGSMEFIKAVKDEVVVSIGHTACDYETAKTAILQGASHITHLFNAMNGFTHRAPGVIGAGSESNVYAELICDGIHIDGSAIRGAFKLFEDRICLISDSMSACGMENGEYELGGQKVFVKDKKATLVDGTIAGSATNLFDCMKKAIEFGVSPEIAIKSATYNPAKSIGMEGQIGSIDIGLDADILVLDRAMNLEKVYFKGIEK